MRARTVVGAAALLLLAVTPARATVTAGAGGRFVPVALAQRGGPLVFINLDTDLHNLVARDDTRVDGSRPFCEDYEPGRCPAFWTPLVGYGSAVRVEGVEDLPAGEYPFHCELHQDMTGTLVVVAGVHTHP